MENYDSSLRTITRTLLDRIAPCELVIGIPSFNNGTTIARVVEAAVCGLKSYFPDRKSCIIVADGGSTVDDTREAALAVIQRTGIPGVVGIYRGKAGKGSAVRMIFEAARHLNAKATALLDADLRSISDFWIERLLSPIVKGGHDFVTPLYKRYKYDGTITNNITYNMLRSIYGKRIRQPIGGEFAFSTDLTNILCDLPVWETDVARFGIDIWLTIQAIIRKMSICQTHLGVKIHDARDPAASLEPMFRQIVNTLFEMMEETEDIWMNIHESETIPVWGEPLDMEPEAFPIDFDRLLEHLFLSWATLSGSWKAILQPSTFTELLIHMETGKPAFTLPEELWARILYEFAAAYHHRPVGKKQVVEVLSPLYFARVASFMTRTKDFSNQEADAVVEEQAKVFELWKPYLLKHWAL